MERRIAAVLQPGSTEEIQKIVRCANEFNISLYPISTGKNWGYGSANPVGNDNVIIDLQRLNRITEVNTELAYAVVEPGVTQQQLYDYLQENNTGLMMDPTGSGPYCSILGNALERGYGITPYGDHFESICGMEIVLADGNILRTGFGHFDNAKATRVFKYGTGPFIDGLFTQSNFGIVTKIGVWLMPKPEYFEACYFFAHQENNFGDIIDAVRWLLLNRIVKGSINLVHRNRSLTLLAQYPWEQMQGATPLSEKAMAGTGSPEKCRPVEWGNSPLWYTGRSKGCKKSHKKGAERQGCENFFSLRPHAAPGRAFSRPGGVAHENEYNRASQGAETFIQPAQRKAL